MILLPISNCCAATALMPSPFGALMTERSFVPKMPAATALSSSSSSLGMSFISWTPSFSIRRLDDRALLRAKNAGCHGLVKQLVEFRHVLHQLDTVLLLSKSLVNFQERDNLLCLPEVRGRCLSIDVAVHGRLKKDGANRALPGKLGVLDDARTHLMHLVHHLRIAGVLGLLDAVELQGLRSAPATLVQRGEEAVLVGDLVQHLLLRIHGALASVARAVRR